MLIKLSIILLVSLIGKYHANIDYNDDYQSSYQVDNCYDIRREIYLRDREIIKLKRLLKSNHGNQWKGVGRTDNAGLSNYEMQEYQYPHETNEVIIIF